MAKTLAELRGSEHVGLPERTYPLCLAGKLVAEIEVLEAEYELVEDSPKGGRVGARSQSRQLAEKIERLREEMNEHVVPVRLRAKQGHEWRAWVNARPPREGEFLDQRTGLNLDKAIADLHEFVLHVSDEPLGAGDWEFIVSTAADGDLKNMVAMLIDLHNKGVSIPKSRLNSESSQESSSD